MAEDILHATLLYYSIGMVITLLMWRPMIENWRRAGSRPSTLLVAIGIGLLIWPLIFVFWYQRLKERRHAGNGPGSAGRGDRRG